MEQTDARFKALFYKQILQDIKFYNVKEEVLALEDGQKWVLQGGVEFIFDDHMVSLGWNSEMHLYEMIEGDLDQLLGEIDVYDVELDLLEEFAALKGKQIDEVSFNWNFYQKMDDEMELTDEKIYIPQEILLTFENKDILQVATVLFHLKKKQISNVVFDPQGNLLVSLNQPLEIRETPINEEDNDSED